MEVAEVGLQEVEGVVAFSYAVEQDVEVEAALLVPDLASTLGSLINICMTKM